MKLNLALQQLYHSETALGDALDALAARHRGDHGIHYVGRDLASWSRDHIRDIASSSRAFGVRVLAASRGPPHLSQRLRMAALCQLV